MTDGENTGAPGAESWLTVVKDIILGGAAGTLLAVVWIVVFALLGSDGGGGGSGFGWSIKGCGLFLLLVVWIAAGALIGLMIGEGTGAAIGGVTSYLLPFIAYGAYIQSTIGWIAWLRGNAHNRDAEEMNGPKE